jgi:hypothetical protein
LRIHSRTRFRILIAWFIGTLPRSLQADRSYRARSRACLKRSRTDADPEPVRTLARVPSAGAALAAILCSAAATPAHAVKTAALPLTRDAPDGQRVRLSRGKPVAGDDSPASWCLRLRYTTGSTLNGDPFAEGMDICGSRPAPRVSGAYTADCEHNILYVFGGISRAVDGVDVVRADGVTAHAGLAELPNGSGFSGHAFVVAIKMFNFPATVRETSVPRPGARLPLRREICFAPPGRPEPASGGFGDFRW